MKFTKMHGAGNDFLLVQGHEDCDWPVLAQAMCERHFGAGADGVILVLPSTKADVRMRLFNADGSEAEVSGNGVRCLVKYAVERGPARQQDGKVTIEAIHAVLEAGVEVDGPRVRSVRLSMGPPGFEPGEVPVVAEMSPPIVDLPLNIDGERIAVTCLSMGNPHAVTFIDGPVRDYHLETIGPKVEHHPAFPARVNFGVGRLLSRDHMELRVWERGCGETLACGSGSCAAMVAARLKGLAGDTVDITQPGGQLTVEWDGRGDVFLSGDARFVFEGDWPGD